MNLSNNEIESIVKQVVKNVSNHLDIKDTKSGSNKWGVFDDMNDAVMAAHKAFIEYKERSKQCRKKRIPHLCFRNAEIKRNNCAFLTP